MRTLSVLFIMLSFLSWGVLSQAETKQVQLLTFHEFKGLASADRSAYLESLRAMALKAERSGGKVTVSEYSGSPRLDVWTLLLAQANAAQGDSCIYAGYISTRDSRNNCVRPASASGHCGSGTLCNPMLYGFGANGQGGICTSDRSYPTRDCESKYQALPDYKASKVADQIVSRGSQADFNRQSAALTAYCSSAASSEQKNMCKSLTAKASFMRAKVVAAEQRKKAADQAAAAKPVTPVAPVQEAPAAKPPVTSPVATAPPASAPAAVTPQAPAAAPRAQDTAPAQSPVAAGPSAPAAQPAPAASARPQAAADQPAAPTAPVRPADGCFRNVSEYMTLEKELPESFRGLHASRSAGTFIAGDTSFLGGFASCNAAMHLRLVDGKFKLRSHVVPSMRVAPFESDDNVVKICVQRGGKMVFHLAKTTSEVEVSGNSVTVTDTANRGYPLTLNVMTQAQHQNYANTNLVPKINGARPVAAQR